LELVTSANENISLFHPLTAESDTQKLTPSGATNASVERRHICFFFKNPKEQWHLFRTHFMSHSVPETKTVYLYPGDKDRKVNWIISEGCDLRNLLASQTLSLLSTVETYCAGGI